VNLAGQQARNGSRSTLPGLPFLGAGLGYRAELDTQIQANSSVIDWLEIISEHFLGRPPERLEQAQRLRAAFPLIPHGVELSIGTEGPLDGAYVDALAAFADVIDAPWFSDHLCFTRAGGIALGQLIPLPRTRCAAAEVGAKARQVQQQVGRPFLLENITYYFDFDSELTEAQFITEVLGHNDCGLLLDLTNLYINSVNHGFPAEDFLQTIPGERIVQVHLAGGEPSGAAFIDTHSAPVHPEVFALLRETVRLAPNLKGVLIERDQNYPADFAELAQDLATAHGIVGAAG
jgi:uncharacterized protein (UPF0276 family)